MDHRLAYILLELSSEFGFTIPVTREELAQMAGTTTETAIRITNRFKKAGMILPLRKRIIIIDNKILANIFMVSTHEQQPTISNLV